MSRHPFVARAARVAAVALLAAVGRVPAASAQRGAPVPPASLADSTASRVRAARTAHVELASKSIDSTADEPVVMREVFAYEGIGRRDPFFPLISTSELRPFVSDLVLTSVLFDPTGRRSIAVMRDKTGNMQYRVTTGMLLGRMRVTDIRHRAVYFSIQEFGTNRRDSLVLVDTTKVRSR